MLFIFMVFDCLQEVSVQYLLDVNLCSWKVFDCKGRLLINLSCSFDKDILNVRKAFEYERILVAGFLESILQ